MDDQNPNLYDIIPANYTDSGRLLGGMLATRNAVETLIIAAIMSLIEIRWIPMTTSVQIVVWILTVIPMAIAAMIGIDGESLGQYLGHVFRFWKRRRKLHYDRRMICDEGSGEKKEKNDRIGTDIPAGKKNFSWNH